MNGNGTDAIREGVGALEGRLRLLGRYAATEDGLGEIKPSDTVHWKAADTLVALRDALLEVATQTTSGPCWCKQVGVRRCDQLRALVSEPPTPQMEAQHAD